MTRSPAKRPDGVLLSMTGFGEARHQADGLGVAVEVRAVNNRYLKVTVRGSDPYPMLEPELEKVVRRHVRRGTLLIHVRVERQATPTDLALNTGVLQAYLRQIRTACDAAGTPEYAPALLAGALALPGVAPEGAYYGSPPDDEWPAAS